jgi:hypothetical protein
MRARNRLWMALAVVATVAYLCCWATAAEREDKDAAPAKSATGPAKGGKQLSPAEKLADQQQRIAEKYKHLEDVLLRMAELNALTDPRRAALLKKAVAQSKDQLIGVRFEQLVELLGKDRLAPALENQTDLDQDLHALLELLMSENRAKNLENRKKILAEYIKRLNDIIHREEDIQGRTTGGDDHKRLAEEQGKVADNTGGLARDIQRTEESKASGRGAKAGSKSRSKEGAKEKPDDAKAKEKGDKKEGAQNNGDSKSNSGDNKSGDAKPQPGGKEGPNKSGDAKGKGDSKGKPGPKNQGQSPQGQQGEQPPSDNPPQDDDASPARKRLQAAQERMEEAERKLKEAQRQGAAEEQENALRELRKAKAELEEILRQLREEQIGHMLRMLEARFRKMLQMQEEVYEGTVRLDKVPPAERTHNHEIESSRLSGKESQIVVEVDKAILLLREDGTAVAFPEAIGQMRDDMQQVVERLAQVKVGKVTQGIEEDILAALKEMIEALKKAQKDLGKKKPGQQGQGGQPQEPPLIDGLAELRMIRALQMRVNNRTARYSRMIEGEQAENAELVEAIRRLAEREQRILRVTRDLQLGRNQ